MTTYPIQAIFNRGELSPLLHSRIDLEYFRMAYKYGENFVLTRHGGLVGRPGSHFNGTVRNNLRKIRFHKFVFSRDQVYVLEFGNFYIQFWALDGHVIEVSKLVSSVTKANPAVVTYTGTDVFADFDKVYLSGLGGMLELNNTEHTIESVDTVTNKFTLPLVDSINYGTFTGGGTIGKIYKVVTPYSEAEVPDLKFVQSNDVIFIAHKDHAPAQLQRFSETNWVLSDIDFKDGPYLPTPLGVIAKCTPSSNGAGGAATSVIDVEATTTPTALFDGNDNTQLNLGAVPNTIRYNFASGRVFNSYIVVNNSSSGSYDTGSPKNWVIQGSNVAGGPYTTLDARSNEIGWQKGEARYYKFYNVTSYTYYQFKITNGGASGSGVILSEFYWGQNGDYASTMNLTFSNVNGVNGGSGFQASDVGRHIRLFSTNDARHRWFKITIVVSTTVVTGRMYGFTLRDDFNVTEWQLGAFSEQSGWPGCVAFYNNRLVWGRTNTNPLGLYLSQKDNYNNYGVSDPLVDDDGMTLNIASGIAEEILWLVEGTSDLVIGTSTSIRTLGKGDTGKPFGPLNFDENRQSFAGASPIRPVSIGSTIIYVDYHGKSLREFTYNFEINAYISPEVSILSEHLLKSGIIYMDYGDSPEPILWIVNGDGELIGLTYDREQKVVGLHRHRIGGSVAGTSYGIVESVCVVPGLVQDDVWLCVRRVIGTTVRYIERITSFPTEITPKEDDWYLDSAFEYVGVSTNIINSLMHLQGKVVSAFANGTFYSNLTVTSAGKLTLPVGVMVTRALVGLAYEPVVDLLQPVSENQEGMTLNRKKHSTIMLLDLHRTKGLKAGNPRTQEPLRYPEAGSLTENPTELFTGFRKVNYDSRWEDKASIRITQHKPYRVNLRSVILAHDGEP